MTIFINKLVRDRIPEIIKNEGFVPSFRELKDDEKIGHLLKKLEEECAELIEDVCIEELADLLEVVFSIGKYIGLTEEEIYQRRKSKHIERGGFEKFYYLESKHRLDEGE